MEDDSTKQKRSNLCKESMNNKWRYDGNMPLVWKCSFCHDCSFICDECLCPKEICSNYGYDGYIGRLRKVFKSNEDIRIMYVPKVYIDYIRTLFEMYIIPDK